MSNRIGFGFDVDDGGAIRKINGVSQAFDKLGGPGSGASLFGNVGAKAVALGFNLISDAISGTIGFLNDAFDAAVEDQESISRLTQLLQNNIPAWDGNTDAINAYVDAQIEHGFADDQVRESIGQLIGVTHDAQKAQELNTLAQELARAKGIDLAQATDIVTKAAQGNGKALKTLGIDTQGVTTAQGLLDAITKNVTGSMDKYDQTMAGKVNKSQLKFNEAMEKIGYAIMPVVADLMTKFSDDWLPALGRGWDKVYKAIKPVLDILGAVIGALGTAIGKVQDFLNSVGQLREKNRGHDPIGDFLFGGVPQYARGGIVSGPLNSPQLALVHGGERIIPVGDRAEGHSHAIILNGREVARAMDEILFPDLQLASADGT